MNSSNESILQSTVITESGENVIFSSLFNNITLCIFLRHWGCSECNLLLHTLTPRLSELIDLQVRILFVGLGSAEGISEFRSKHQLKQERVAIVTDPTLSIHKKIGLERGLWQIQGPKGYFNRLKLQLQGFPNQTGDGDNLQQGGAILFDQNLKILWQHRNNHFGDILNTNELMNAVLIASVSKSTSN